MSEAILCALCAVVARCPVAMAHTGWMESADSKQVVKKLQGIIVQTFSGSQDPEATDCLHVIDYLASSLPDPAFKASLQSLFTTARHLSPGWVPLVAVTQAPAAPAAMQVVDGWLSIWALGHADSSAVKGRSNMVSILEVAFSILENTFNSAQSPVDVLFHEVPGQTITDFSVRLSVGFIRVLAAKVVLLAMMQLCQEEVSHVLPVLCSLFFVKFTYNPAPSDELQRCRSLAAKFQVSESTRPDPIQIFHTLSEGLKRAGADVTTGLPGKIKEYNAMTNVQSQSISDLEARVVCALPCQTEEFRKGLAYHWQNYKNAESAVPMKMFNFLNADMPQEASGVWKDILSPSPEKNEEFLLHLVAVFLKNLKDLIRLRKKPNLRYGASKLRVGDPVSAYRQACLWVHFRPQMQQEMSNQEFEHLQKLFRRGGFERELTDRVKAMNPTLKLQDFRFICVHLGRDAPVKEQSQLDEAQEEAELQQEKASLRLFEAKLEKDQSTWVKYKAALDEYSSTQRIGKVEFLRAQDQELTAKAAELQDGALPVKFLSKGEHIAPFVGQASAAWLESVMIPAPAAFTVYIVNLTSLGSAALRAGPECVRVIADACAHCPERTFAMLIGPNVAGHGHTYDDTYCEKAQDDTEQLLKQEEHGLRVRRGQIVFAQDSISSRTRSGAHIMWMCMSNQMKNENEVACEFEKSSLWHRRVIAGVQMKPNGEFVLPFAGVPPTSAENLAKAQMFKQHISGVDLINKFKESLWKGMQVSPKNGAVYVDVLPYDDSVLLSTVQSLSKSKPKEPQQNGDHVCLGPWGPGARQAQVQRGLAEGLHTQSH